MYFFRLMYCCLFLLIGCRNSSPIVTEELVKYSAPFYLQKPGLQLYYFGIRTERFFYLENETGPWILNDNHIYAAEPVNLVGFDEYIFIQYDLARQLDSLLLKKHQRLHFSSAGLVLEGRKRST